MWVLYTFHVYNPGGATLNWASATILYFLGPIYLARILPWKKGIIYSNRRLDTGIFESRGLRLTIIDPFWNILCLRYFGNRFFTGVLSFFHICLVTGTATLTATELWSHFQICLDILRRVFYVLFSSTAPVWGPIIF